MPPQITCASALPVKKGKHENCIFSLAVLVHCENSTSRCLISSVFLTHDWHSLLYKSLNLVINACSLGLLEGMVQEKGSRESCSSWTIVRTIMHQCAVFWVPVLQGNTEALDRRGGKTTHIICFFYFLSNTSAVNYHNRIVCIARSTSRQYLIFSEADFEVFGPAGATRCTDGVPPPRQISPHPCNDNGVGPPKRKFLLRFDQNVEYKRSARAYSLRDFDRICRFCTPFQDEGFKFRGSGYRQLFSAL